MKMSLRGLANVEKQMARIERNSRLMADWKGGVFSALPYAWGQEYGRHRLSGRLARRSGGARYLNQARDEMLRGADRDMAEGLSKVSSPGVWVLKRLALWTRRLARAYAPRRVRGVKKAHPYRLYRSINARVWRR